MNENADREVVTKKDVQPLAADPQGEILDWEAYIPPPPPKRKGTIQVRLHYKGRAKPLPVPDPNDE